MDQDTDWKINLKALDKQRMTLLMIKDDQVLFTSNRHGMEALVELLAANRDNLVGTTVVDRVVGTAAAKLLLWQHVRRIDALVASRRAVELLRHSGVVFNFKELVPELVDRKTGETDRFELMSVKHDYAESFYQILTQDLLTFRNE